MAIFLLWVGVLTVEVSLTRIFSYSISYHFAYLTISTALLGFDAAGSLLVAFPLARPSRRIGTIHACDLLGAALGCALAVPLIWALETPAVVVIGALTLAAGFAGVAPRYRMIGYDGGSFAVMYAYDGTDGGLALFRHHVMAVPYRVQPDPSSSTSSRPGCSRWSRATTRGWPGRRSSSCASPPRWWRRWSGSASASGPRKRGGDTPPGCRAGRRAPHPEGG